VIGLIGGIAGKILFVNLTNEEVEVKDTSSELIEKFGGGAGYGTWILLEHISKNGIFDPLSPSNPLIFMTGPLTGHTGFSFKTAVTARSPLTGGLGKSIFSGSWGASLKKAGFDGLVITGASSRPAHLVIDDENVIIRDATSMWGLETIETFKNVKESLGDGFSTVTIGPAGEKLVRIACIESHDGRFAGRTGMGAVMGSKKLKAISVRGTKRQEISDPEGLRKYNNEWLRIAPQTPRGRSLHDYGTPGGVIGFHDSGNLPMGHWTVGYWPDAYNLSGQVYMEKYRLGPGFKQCGDGVVCSIACERQIQYNDPRFGEYKGAGPEYETVAMLGSHLLVSDPIAVSEMNRLCERFGLDTISTGEVLAWFTEVFERGIIGKEETGGIIPKWGDYKTYMELIRLIAYREGIGDILAEGSKRASEKINKGSERFAMHVKGLEVPAHNPRLYTSMGLQYATSNRGACHLQGISSFVERGMLLPEYEIKSPPKTSEEKVNVVITHQNLCNFLDSAILCKFAVFGITDFNLIASLWNSVTGMNWTKDDIWRVGDRIWYLERMVNYLLGFTNRDDNLPDRFVKEPVSEGGAKDKRCDNLDEMLMIFYERRSLRTKKELRKKLEEIGLIELVDFMDRIRLW